MVHDDWMMTEGMPRAYDLGKPQLLLVGGFNPSEKYYIVNGKDYPIYSGK